MVIEKTNIGLAVTSGGFAQCESKQSGEWKQPQVVLVVAHDDGKIGFDEQISMIRSRLAYQGFIIIAHPRMFNDEVLLMQESKKLSEAVGISIDQANKTIMNALSHIPNKPFKIELPKIEELTACLVKEKNPTGYFEGTSRRHNRNNFKYHQHRRK
jgi:hypothetical protein